MTLPVSQFHMLIDFMHINEEGVSKNSEPFGGWGVRKC